MLERVICAVDGSEHSDKAVQLAADLAARYQARLCFVHVFMKGMTESELHRFAGHAHLKDVVTQELDRMAEFAVAATAPHAVALLPPPSEAVVRRIAEVILEDARQEAVHRAVTQVTTTMMDGDPAECILDLARQEEADMIVLGNRGLGTLGRIFMGGVSQ